MNNPESELVELQSRLSFQEDAINSLNDVVAKQNIEIQNLQKQLQLLYKKIDEQKYEHEQNGSIPDSPPPHY